MADQTVVDVKTAWGSKINWTQAVAAVAMIATWFGIQVPDDVRAAIVTAIAAITTIVTWVLRTWFTTAVTPGSVK